MRRLKTCARILCYPCAINVILAHILVNCFSWNLHVKKLYLLLCLVLNVGFSYASASEIITPADIIFKNCLSHILVRDGINSFLRKGQRYSVDIAKQALLDVVMLKDNVTDVPVLLEDMRKELHYRIKNIEIQSTGKCPVSKAGMALSAATLGVSIWAVLWLCNYYQKNYTPGITEASLHGAEAAVETAGGSVYTFGDEYLLCAFSSHKNYEKIKDSFSKLESLAKLRNKNIDIIAAVTLGAIPAALALVCGALGVVASCDKNEDIQYLESYRELLYFVKELQQNSGAQTFASQGN